MELEGRTALVTDGSGDIGAAVVRGLAKRGAHVAIHYHGNVAKAESLRVEVLSLGRRSVIVQADLASGSEIERLAEAASALGPIDILVNNAGSPIRRITWMDLDATFLALVFGLNFRAPLYLCQLLTPTMVAPTSSANSPPRDVPSTASRAPSNPRLCLHPGDRRRDVFQGDVEQVVRQGWDAEVGEGEGGEPVGGEQRRLALGVAAQRSRPR